MAYKVALQHGTVLALVLREKAADLRAEFIEGRSEGHVQHLPRVERVQEGRQIGVVESATLRHLTQAGVEEVRLAVLPESSAML